MAIPTNIQDRMLEYEQKLSNRYPLSYTYYKIGAPYSKINDAVLDLTPKYNIFTNDDSSPKLGSRIYTNYTKTKIYSGVSQWHHVFDSSSSDLEFLIKIDFRGIVIDVQSLK